MLFINVNNGIAARHFAVLTASAALLAFGLAACSSDDAGPGTPFTQALAKSYTDLATQASALPPPADSGSFWDSINIFSSGNPNDALSKDFSDKADEATAGNAPDPEVGPSDPSGQDVRARLVRDLEASKDQLPAQAAAAQADYDCWAIASAVPSAAAMAQACHTSLGSALIALESGGRAAPVAPPPPPMMPVQPAPPPPPAPAPAPAAANAANFTVYFDFDSWTLTAEDLKVITDVINSARTGGQTHIVIVGHTDTSGTAEYNQRLSVRRANVVVEALVDLGARRAAIKASGVGKNDLAVQTPDGVKNAENRRAVIDLQP